MYLSSRLLKQLKSLAYKIAKIGPLPLIILNLISNIGIIVPKYIEDRQYLSIVGHECLSNHLSRQNQLLYHLQHSCDDVRVPGIEGS
jgi:hypothetical protein